MIGRVRHDCLCLVVCLTVWTLFLFYTSSSTPPSHPPYTLPSPPPSPLSKPSSPNELVSSDQFPKIPEDRIECVPYAPGVKRSFLKLCVWTNDELISIYVKFLGGWETNILYVVLQAMIKYPSASFLDLGSNIGIYTVAVAALRPSRKVFAVDADSSNLAFIRRSLMTNGDTANVRLFHNAVSSSPGTLYPHVKFTSNPGATEMKSQKELKALGEEAVGVEAVTLKEVLDTIPSSTVILKLDIEGFECKALLPPILLGASGKQVPFIFMEWTNIVSNPTNCPEYPVWKDFFFLGGFTPHTPDADLSPISNSSLASMIDVIWIHKSVPLFTTECYYEEEWSDDRRCYKFW